MTPVPNTARTNRHIRLLGAGILVLFIALFAQLNYVQVVHAKALDNNPLNGREVVKEYTAQRGNIVSSDGTVLATSVPSNDSFKYLRQYPTGPLFAEVTGFYSFTYGSDGAERYYDKVLTGAQSPFSIPTNLKSLQQLLTNNDKSQNIELTVSDKLQTVARNELAGRLGSVVAVEPKTGAILAMYSNPTFDPNQLSGHNQQTVEAAYKAIEGQSGGPLDFPAYRQTWFPGSTFKIVTAAAVYDHDPSLINKPYPQLAALPLPQTTTQLHNFAGEVCGGVLLTLFERSCDTGFGQVGLDLGAASLSSEATSFGFDQTPPLDLPFAAKSNFPPTSFFSQNLPLLAYSAIGQDDVQASPLEMAMVAGAIGDNGIIMTPHILASVTNSSAQTVETYTPTKWLQATSPSTAAQMTVLMESVVSPAGTAPSAAIPGIQVAGKTGTAQTGTGKTDDWFVAFAPANNPQIAVSVVLPDQGGSNEFQGGTIAAPIARAVIQSYLTATPSPGATPASGASAGGAGK